MPRHAEPPRLYLRKDRGQSVWIIRDGEKTSELAALKASVSALKSGSLSTLRKSTPRDHQKAGSPIPFPSRKSSGST